MVKNKETKFKKVVKYDFRACFSIKENPLWSLTIMYVMSAAGFSLWRHKFMNLLWIAPPCIIMIILIVLFFTREVHWEEIK